MQKPAETVVGSVAASASTLQEMALAQLHADAQNSLSVALWHLRQPVVNVPGALRKAVQALAAMNRMRAVGTNDEGGA